VVSDFFRIFAPQLKRKYNMAKIFTSKLTPSFFYKVIDEKWLDKDTYVVIFQDMIDIDGDTYHLEVEYHKDEDKFTYTRVYDYENVEAFKFVSPCFRKQIEEYVLQQVGVLREGSFVTEQEVVTWLKLDVPKDTSMGELCEFLNSLKFEVVHTMTPRDEKIKVLSIETTKRRV
jgi:hypothetical protein